MNITPTLDQVNELMKTQQYDVIPVSMEILSDFITPIETMRKLRNVSEHCYMLESAQADELRILHIFGRPQGKRAYL